MRLRVAPQNVELLTKLAKRLGNTTPTAALNFALEKSLPTMLERIETMQVASVPSQSAASPDSSVSSPSRPTAGRQIYTPELEGTAESALFD